MGDRIRMKRLCREAVDCSGDWNGVDSVDSVDSVWFCYLSLTPFVRFPKVEHSIRNFIMSPLLFTPN